MLSDDERRPSVSNASNKERDAYFVSHKCSLNEVPNKYTIRCGRARRFLLYLTAVNFNDVRARSKFKSYASLCAERYRQYVDCPIVIHPFSRLCFLVELLLAIEIITHTLLLPFLVSGQKYSHFSTLHEVLSGLQIVYLCLNVPTSMLTGYVDGKNDQHIVLDKWRITEKYFVKWIFIDLVVFCCMLQEIDPGTNAVYQLLHLLSISQLLILYRYEQNICKVLNIGVPWQTALELVLLLIVYLSWNIVFQFTAEYYMEGSVAPDQPRNCSWITINHLWEKPTHVRLIRSLYRAVDMLRKNANTNLLEYDGCFEIFYIVSWIIAQLLVIHCAFKYMLALFGSQSAKMKYYMMSRQLQTYMDQRRFPPRIQRKILKFYSIRFQSHFFVESTMMECLSGQLREDVFLRTGRQLVRGITFLKQLPRSVLIHISLKFELAIFLEGDIIYKAKAEGDCMFFIHKGTAAFYTNSGCEIFHCDDGEYFGEVALLTKHKKRMVTAVAVTNCELFSLSRENFKMIECYPTAYEELKKVALRRLQLAKVRDEQFKAQLKDLHEKSSKAEVPTHQPSVVTMG